MFDQRFDNENIRSAIDLHLREISREQMRKFEGYMAEIFEAFGLNLNTPATYETPRRFLEGLFEATEGYDGDPKLLKVFDTECRGDPDCRLGQVIEGPIPFFALCEHHAFPFHGYAHIGYIPHEHIIGISKLTRLVRLFARRFAVQERLGEQIVNTFNAMLQPHGVAVYLEAHHLCTEMRGVRETSPLTRTTVWRGEYEQMRRYGSNSCSPVERICEYADAAGVALRGGVERRKENSMRLEGQVVLITGVSHAGQVGYALAAAFAHEGAHLAISARTAERVNARAQELRARGASVIAIPADLTTEEGANTLIQKTLAAYGRIDVLVNLAGGLTTYSPPDELTLAAWEAELNNNLRSAFLCTRAVWPIMKRQGGGKILNFSRAGGVHSSGPMMLAYNCAKAGIDALTYTFARAGKDMGIAVNAIGPGLIVTQSNVESMKPTPEEIRAKWVSMEHIVEAAIFLVSPVGDGVNGVVLPVQGKGI